MKLVRITAITCVLAAALQGCAQVKESLCDCNEPQPRAEPTREHRPRATATKTPRHVSLPREKPAAAPVVVAPPPPVTPPVVVRAPLSDAERRARLCPRTAYLRKAVAVNLFERRELESAKAGRLEHIEAGLALLFSDALTRENNLPAASYYAPIPLNLNERERQIAAQHIARRQQSQFVLQGVIDDMSQPDANKTYHPTLLDHATYLITDRSGATALDKRHRYFGLTLELRDGFTGEAIFTKSYHTWALWKFRHPVGFNTAEFQRSPYAQKIRELVDKATGELADTLACQPLIAPLDIHPGRRDMIFAGGANHGLRAGDQLTLYQWITSGSNTDYMVTHTRLVKRPQQLTLTEVYPAHANAHVINGQPLSGLYLGVKE